MKKTNKILSVLLIFSIIFSFTTQVFAAVTLPSISSITCYTINSSGKVYAYTANDLNKKTGGYIDCSTDECQILKVSGNALQVKYSAGKTTKTAWFKRSEFTSCDIAKREATEKWTQASKITTYRRSDGKTAFGSVSAGDVCYKLTSKGNYTQILYPISGEKKYKMGWVLSSDLSNEGSKTNLSYGLYKDSSAYISCGFDSYVKQKGKHEGIDIICKVNAPV